MPQGPSFWFDTRIYLAVAATLLVVIAFYNHYLAVLGVILLYALYMYGRERYVEQQKALADYLELMAGHVDDASWYALQQLPLAIAIIDETGSLYWRNNVLVEWIGDKAELGFNLLEVWPELSLEALWGQSGTVGLKVNDRYYQIIYRPVSDDVLNNRNLMILYITDITQLEVVRTECHDAMPVFANIQIDNYDDVLKGLNEGQRTNLLAEVNRYLSDWVSELDGFLKKYAEDMYIAIFNRRALEKSLHDRFDILDRIRTIRSGNKIPVTLSMGIAADEPNIAALGQRAQAGLDLALGRGGDQVAVHTEGKVQFYGGKAKAVEKNTKVKARIVAQAIRELVMDADKVLIMGHTAEDFDSLGAALGVAKMVGYLDKDYHVVVSQPSLTFAKLRELLADYEEDQDIFITPAEAADLATAETLVFIVDTHRPQLVAAPELLKVTERAVVIDHHRRAEGFIINPLLVYLEPSASSTSELVTELLQYFDDNLDLTRLEASALYAGIIVDTKNFAVQTGVRTFEAASYLRRAGADPTLVRHLFRLDFDTIRSQAEIINKAEMFPGGVVVTTCPNNTKNAQIIAAQTADMLLNIEGVRVSFVLFSLDNGVGVSARSQGDINVQVVMEQLGGGGHQTVAGAQIKNQTIAQVKAKVIELAAKYIEESEVHESNSAARSKKTW